MTTDEALVRFLYARATPNVDEDSVRVPSEFSAAAGRFFAVVGTDSEHVSRMCGALIACKAVTLDHVINVLRAAGTSSYNHLYACADMVWTQIAKRDKKSALALAHRLCLLAADTPVAPALLLAKPASSSPLRLSPSRKRSSSLSGLAGAVAAAKSLSLFDASGALPAPVRDAVQARVVSVPIKEVQRSLPVYDAAFAAVFDWTRSQTWAASADIAAHVALLLDEATGRGLQDKVIGHAFHELGLYYDRSGNISACVARLEQALACKQAVYGKSSSKGASVAATMHELGRVYSSLGQLQRAEAMLMNAIERAGVAKDTNAVITSRNLLGTVQRQQGEFSAAENTLQDVLEAKRKAYGDNSRHLVSTLHAMGRIAEDRAMYDRALAMFDKARDLLPDNSMSGEYASLQLAIGQVRAHRGEFDAAAQALGEALAVFQRIYGKTSAQAAQALHAQGVLQLAKHEPTEARVLFESALQLKLKLYGQHVDHPSIALAQRQIGLALTGEGDLAGALARLDLALAMYQRLFGAAAMQHHLVAQTIHDRAAVLQDQGDIDEALELYQQALAIKRKAFGSRSDHPSIAASLHAIGMIHHTVFHNYSVALDEYKQVLRILSAVHGDKMHPDAAATLHQIGRLHQDQKHYDDAKRYYEQCLEVEKAVFNGEDNAAVATTLLNIGSLLLEQGEVPDSRKLIARAVSIRQRVLGPSHASTVAAEHWLKRAENKSVGAARKGSAPRHQR